MNINISSKKDPLSGNMWDPLFSEQALNLKSSEIRALFAVVSRPEVVSLAGGMPNLAELPLAQIGDLSSNLIANDGQKALQYGDGHGWNPLRQKIVDVMEKENVVADPSLVQITTGSQQALQLVSDLFIEPGQVILTESPTYVGALGVFQSKMAEVVHIKMDNQGLVPRSLRQTIESVRKSGKTIKYLYTVPNFHNPAGVSLSLQRRPEIVDICKHYGILIVEDNPYGLLGFDTDPLPALQSYWPQGVIYLGSFSKIFAPGFRIGWALAPKRIYDKLVLAAEAAILSPSMTGQMIIAKYLDEFDWHLQVRNFSKMYFRRWQTMQEALNEHLTECTWTTPKGGFYTWVTLPKGIDSKEMLPSAVDNLVAYVPGTAFYYDDRGRDHMRLSFCYPPQKRIREGVERLGQVIRNY